MAGGGGGVGVCLVKERDLNMVGLWPHLSARKGTRLLCPLVLMLQRIGSLGNHARLRYC